jgi:hypothetical protein
VQTRTVAISSGEIRQADLEELRDIDKQIEPLKRIRDVRGVGFDRPLYSWPPPLTLKLSEAALSEDKYPKFGFWDFVLFVSIFLTALVFFYLIPLQ